MKRPLLLALFSLLLLSSSSLSAQLEPPSTGGVPALMRELSKLGHYERVLMIGAHPDDEDTELLMILSRGEGAETAYLSLTRGEGGQNLIGPELGDALGILRTEELLAARRIDGGQQFFTRAYDFGFSKTIDDAWKHWPQDSVLKDVVRIIRRFRPQIVVSVFSGTPRDGHGQHQVAGWAAKKAFEVAGDSARFPELWTEEHLAPWAPLKLYRSARFDTASTVVSFDGGAIDPVTGKTYRQLAMAGRSLHRSQKMGQLQPIGPSTARVTLWEDRTGKGAGGFWAGVDTTLAGAVTGATEYPAQCRAMLASVQSLVDSAKAGVAVGGPSLAVPYLARALDLWGLQSPAGELASRRYCGIGLRTGAAGDQGSHLWNAISIASGLLVDAVASRARALAGGDVDVDVSVRNGYNRSVVVETRVGAGQNDDSLVNTIVAPDTTMRAKVSAGGAFGGRYRVTFAKTYPPTTPYFLAHPRHGDLYTWHAYPWELGAPFDDPEINATALIIDSTTSWTIGDRNLEATARILDPASGEIRRPVFIVPRVSVKLTPDEILLPLGKGSITFKVTIEHGARDTTTGEVRLELPDGWQKATPKPFVLTKPDEEQEFSFEVRPPANAKAGTAQVRAVAVDSKGARYEIGTFLIDYPHIHPRQYTKPAAAEVVLADVTMPAVRAVGYVRGAADHEPEALIATGLPITILDSAALSTGDLSRFDAIVIGPRAYEVDTALINHNDRLLTYARNGGRVVVQYQQQVFFAGGYAPFAMSLSGNNDRTTDETAPVTALVPDSPDLRSPNTITTSDWDGWIQERSLYCAHTWASAYQPILSMADPGEAPISGCLLEAKVGRGSWEYNALAFHRQLPGGVAGAFRLFVNLLGSRPRP